jgi:phosphate/phosphite/phosphonate ABC transporter binding protein
MKIVLLIIVLLVSHVNFALAEQELKPLHFGVLSYRPKEITVAQWLPLVKELEKNLAGYRVELTALDYSELDKATKDGQIDLILTNPEHYILLKNKIGINAVATIIALENGHPLTTFAGVIFIRADRTDIQTLDDLNGKKIASPGEQSLGGYLMQRWELEKNNVTANYIFTGMPHDKVIEEVLSGKVDAGFVRSGILEKLEQTGKIVLGENPTIRVLSAHLITEQMPVLHSTDHYPEWAFAVSKNISQDMARRISLLLLNIKPDSDIAKAAGIAGFNSPADYTSVEVLMLRLRTHPNELKYFNFSDVLWRYKDNVIVIAIIAILILGLTAFLIHANKRLKKLHFENKKLLLAIEQSPFSVVITNLDAEIEYVNPTFTTVTGYQFAEVVGKNPRILQSGKTDKVIYDEMWEKLRRGEKWHGEILNRRKDGSEYMELASITPIREDNGNITHYLGIKQDITERKKVEKELQEGKNRLQTIIETNPECIQIVNAQGKLIQMNSAGLAMIEADSLNQVATKSVLNFVVPEYRVNAEQLHRRVIAGESMQMEFEIIGLKGTRRWMETHAVPMLDNGNIVRLAVTRDITERKKLEEDIRQLAFYDPLTGLPNRRKLLDRLNYSIQLSHREGKKFAVLMMDLDRFKAVNDTFGHAAGDDLLKQVAVRITERLRDSDLVARLGGDEFVIVLENVSDTEDVSTVALDVIADLTVPFELQDKNVVQISASIGISFYPWHGISPEKLMDNADTALYQAKDSGRGRFVYYENF